MDGFEAAVEVGEDVGEFGIFGAGKEFGDLRHEQGNLKTDLVVIIAVEDAIEFGVIEGIVQFLNESSFGFGGFGVTGDEGVFIFAVSDEVG